MTSNDVIEMQNLVIAFEKGREAKNKEWVSRIQKRIDELKEDIEHRGNRGLDQFTNDEDRIKIEELEGLLKE